MARRRRRHDRQLAAPVRRREDLRLLTVRDVTATTSLCRVSLRGYARSHTPLRIQPLEPRRHARRQACSRF